MASKAASPGAAILRQSRLFAMPKPLPPPLSYRLGHQEPAPYPTVQAITAPTASRVRGNWGLKRDVPHKITHTTMRVTELDTIERFMTFESANDDVLTLKKWHEIDLPLVKSPTLVGELMAATRPIDSVFDDNLSAGEGYKWKYLGPFLLDMPADEFKRYVLKKVKPRQKEFEAFVEKHMAGARGVYESAATADGETRKVKVNMDELRADTMKFLGLVADFLDIPRSGRPYRTHPSAGLHYTRSAAHIPYDPEHGPRPSRSVPGRSLNSGPPNPVVGVGGVAAVLRENNNYLGNNRTHGDRRQVRDYEPRSAYISTRGRIMMDVKPAVSYEEGMRGEGPGTIWGSGDAGSVRDQLMGLVPGQGRRLDGWGTWGTDSEKQQGDGKGDGKGGGGGLSKLHAPRPRFSETFTKPGQAKENGKRDNREAIDDILASLTKK
ncbi:mitochondrial ribosomal protein subunit-domain-containing protein [Tuber borchii]|uniref:Mitochondrial ribosomal protein subunit-domain-containing protein n=1 Tax=Tuber borchii TaxID=42251 RepID=A0A2T6ZIH0_TUBBO|nr:mitochondrial ribosomal protein subunit-domain-containing protein [Tuber borchii]